MEAKASSSGQSRIGWPDQYPHVAIWKRIIDKCHFIGRIIIPVLAIAFMITYWIYAVTVYNRG